MKTLSKNKLYEMDLINFDWQELHLIFSSSCSCVTIETDLESYVDLTYKNSNCILNIENFLTVNGLKYKEKVKRNRNKVCFNEKVFFDNIKHIEKIPQQHDMVIVETTSK